MKPWRDLSEVPLPKSMEHLPRDPRGYVVPWNTARKADGTYSFKVTDLYKVRVAAQNRLCMMCGQRLGLFMALMGAPSSICVTRTFVDGHMHPECARYAVQTCPHLGMTLRKSRKESDAAEFDPSGGSQIVKQEDLAQHAYQYTGIGLTLDCMVFKNPNGFVFQPGPWAAVEWWSNGHKYTPTDWELETAVKETVELLQKLESS